MYGTYYPQPPQVTFGVPYKFSYSSLLINYVPSVISEDINVFQTTNLPLRLEITNPTSRLPGHIHAYAAKTVVVIPIDGVVKLKLIPSELYLPLGYYDVSVMEKGNKVPLEKQKWLVPYVSGEHTMHIVRGSTDRDYILSLSELDISNVSHSDDYQIEGNYIIWGSNSPSPGTTYTIEYRRSLNLSEVIVDRPR
jgi:hypothetical protein